ncbi:MAG: hypothetical protein ABI972_32305 [Acidobacteriota bacterium]
MFRLFRSLYLDVVGGSTTRFEEAVAPVIAQIEQLKPTGLWNAAGDIALLSAQPEIHRAIGPWLDCGFAIQTEEGMWFPVAGSVVMMEFVPRLPAALGAYVRFRAHEDAEVVAGDAALGLTWRQLAERLLRWEDFGRLHSQMPEVKFEVKPEIDNLSGMFLFGLDNTPTYIAEKIDPGLIAVWRWFAARSPRSKFTPLIREMLHALAHNSDKLTEQDHALFASYGLGEQFDGWLRIMKLQTQTQQQ